MSPAARSSTLFCIATLILCTAAHADDLVDNPKYQEWSHFQPGAFVSAKTDTKMRDNLTTAEMTRKLVAVTPEKITLEVTMTLQQNVSTTRQEIPAKVPKAKATAADALPEQVTGELKHLPDEDVTVAGKAYKCKVVSFTGEEGGTPVSGKIWTSPDVPGHLVKSDMHIGDPPNLTNSTIVTAVDAPPKKP
jgi:hypothetical protein